MLITIIRNADRVKIGCLAQLVNVIAPIMTSKMGGAWAQTIFYPVMQASMLGRGKSLLPQISCEKFDTAHYSDVPMVDAAAVLAEDGSVTIFAVNRNLEEGVALDCDLRSFGEFKKVTHTVLHHDDMKAVNTEENPDGAAAHSLGEQESSTSEEKSSYGYADIPKQRVKFDVTKARYYIPPEIHDRAYSLYNTKTGKSSGLLVAIILLIALGFIVTFSGNLVSGFTDMLGGIKNPFSKPIL
jgi:hypothetical protein